MKSTYYTTSSLRFFILLALLISFSTSNVYAQKKASKKLSRHEIFFSNIEKLEPGMSQEEVKSIMGKPYKLAFEQSDDEELEKSIYYKIEVYIEGWTLIVYQCKFKNNKLEALKQKEILYYKDFPLEL